MMTRIWASAAQVLHDIDRSNNGTSHMKQQFGAFFSGYNAYTFPFPVKLVDDIPKLSKLPKTMVPTSPPLPSPPLLCDSILRFRHHTFQMLERGDGCHVTLLFEQLIWLIKYQTDVDMSPSPRRHSSDVQEQLGGLAV